MTLAVSCVNDWGSVRTPLFRTPDAPARTQGQTIDLKG
jgi:hypothetical protein